MFLQNISSRYTPYGYLQVHYTPWGYNVKGDLLEICGEVRPHKKTAPPWISHSEAALFLPFLFVLKRQRREHRMEPILIVVVNIRLHVCCVDIHIAASLNDNALYLAGTVAIGP